jgi:GWxTD domain-containing protein
MKHLILLLSILSTLPLFSQNKVDFEFDYAQFGYDTTSNYVEFYYSFNQVSLTVVNTDSVDYIQGILHISITDSATGEFVVNNSWLAPNIIRDSSDFNKSLIGAIGFVIGEGVYYCKLSGADAQDSLKTKTIDGYLRINPFLKLSASMSDLQLASNIIPQSTNKSSIFYKNTYEVTPMPTAIFGENQPVLFFYTELYNLLDESGSNNLKLNQLVFNSRDQLIIIKSKQIDRKIDSRVEVGTLHAYKLPTDTYTLVCTLIDSTANQGVSSSKKFFVYNPGVAYVDTFTQQTSSVLSTAFGVMSEEELDDLFSKSRYIATQAEIDQYDLLSNENGKREFMFNYWESRNNDPLNSESYSYLAYVKRVKESNAKYKAMGKEGWKTDRGRIYIMYGEPSEIERFPNKPQTRPYEIWNYYDIEGGVYFVFGDITGFSDYQVIHSTKRGELRDESWERRITVR